MVEEIFRWKAVSVNFHAPDETDTVFEFENITAGVVTKTKLIKLLKHLHFQRTLHWLQITCQDVIYVHICIKKSYNILLQPFIFL